MQNQIKLFESTEVRFIPDGNSFWVVGKDVLQALEYAESSITQVSNVFTSVPEEWKGHKPIMTLGGTQQVLCISEQGLYFFLGRSDKPKALPYQKWIAGEVVPSLRKTGEYVIEKPQTLPPTAYEKFQIMRDTLSLAYEGNQLVLAVDKVCVRLTGESALKIAEVQLIAPQQQQLYTPTEIGKSVEPPCSARKVNEYLKDLGWQIRANDKWEAVGEGSNYAVYLDTGIVHLDGKPIRELKWTADTIFAIQEYLNS